MSCIFFSPSRFENFSRGDFSASFTGPLIFQTLTLFPACPPSPPPLKLSSVCVCVCGGKKPTRNQRTRRRCKALEVHHGTDIKRRRITHFNSSWQSTSEGQMWDWGFQTHTRADTYAQINAHMWGEDTHILQTRRKKLQIIFWSRPPLMNKTFVSS